MLVLHVAVARLLTRALIIVLAHSLSQGSYAEEPLVRTETQRDLLVNTWDAQFNEIAAAEIAFRRFTHSGDFKPLSPDQVKDIYLASDLLADEFKLKDLVNSLLLQPHRAEKPWSELTYLMESDRTREESFERRVHVFDGADEIVTDPANSTVTLGQPPGPPMYRNQLGDFRYIVPRGLHSQVTLGEPRADGLRALHIGNSPESSRSEFVVDPQTGAVYEHIQKYPDGGVFRQLLQSRWATVPPGIEFPLTRAEFEYSRESGFLRGAKIVVVSTIRVNHEIPADAFKVTVERGTRIRDFRGERERDDYAASDGSDVKTSIASSGSSLPVPRLPQERNDHNIRFWLIVVNAAALAAIAGGHVLWRRAATRRRSE